MRNEKQRLYLKNDVRTQTSGSCGPMDSLVSSDSGVRNDGQRAAEGPAAGHRVQSDAGAGLL